MYYKITDEGRLDKNGTKEKKKEKEEKDTSIKMKGFWELLFISQWGCSFIEYTRIHNYKIWWIKLWKWRYDKHLQKMSNYDSRIKDIIENQDQYPKGTLDC